MKTQRQGSYTVREAAKELNISEKSVRRLKERGVLKAIPLGLRSVRFPKVDVDALLVSLKGN